jgi:hypothetical protein
MRPTLSENHDTPSVPIAGQSVPIIVQSIRSDHRKMEHLLDILEQELAIFRRDEPPDFDILSGLVEYFRFYPECAAINPRKPSLLPRSRCKLPIMPSR